jgi:hypothetical protein
VVFLKYSVAPKQNIDGSQTRESWRYSKRIFMI